MIEPPDTLDTRSSFPRIPDLVQPPEGSEVKEHGPIATAGETEREPFLRTARVLVVADGANGRLRTLWTCVSRWHRGTSSEAELWTAVVASLKDP